MQTLLATKIVVVSSGVFFLVGMFVGIAKWRGMMRGPTHLASPYIDIAHRASLLYSFACLVLAKFVEYSPYSSAVTAAAAGIPVLCFASAVANYLLLAARGGVDNQFRERNFVTTWGMVLLLVGEIGGFGVLFVGYITSQLT